MCLKTLCGAANPIPAAAAQRFGSSSLKVAISSVIFAKASLVTVGIQDLKYFGNTMVVFEQVNCFSPSELYEKTVNSNTDFVSNFGIYFFKF